MTRPVVVLKGTKDGLVIVLDEEAELPVVMACLEERLQGASDFWQGAKVIVEVGKRKLTLWEAKQLIKVLRSKRGLEVVGFQRGRQRVRTLEGVLTEQTSTSGGEEVGNVVVVNGDRRETSQNTTEDHTLFVRRTLRSGQIINYHGTVVIIGDVNPGAEVIAGGDIIVLGVLRGVAHAGAAGATDAVVAALRLEPTQLRIADVFTRSPDGELTLPKGPEVALLQQGTIVIDTYLALGDYLRESAAERSGEEKEELPWAK